MPGTRSSARLAEKQSSPPAASQETKDNKRKADDSQSSPSKKGRKNTAEQKTIEETLKPAKDANSESKPSAEAGQTETAEQKPAADSVEQKSSEQSSEQKPSEQTNAEMKDDGSIKQVGESYQGENREGESKDDPEKALKDSRGGAGLNSIEPDKPKPKPDNLPIVSTVQPLANSSTDRFRTTSTATSLLIPRSRPRRSPRKTRTAVLSRKVRSVLSKFPATSKKRVLSTSSPEAVLALTTLRASRTCSVATSSCVPSPPAQS